MGKAVAYIKMNAQWTDVDKNVVKIKTTSRFAYDMTDEFRIALSLQKVVSVPIRRPTTTVTVKKRWAALKKKVKLFLLFTTM